MTTGRGTEQRERAIVTEQTDREAILTERTERRGHYQTRLSNIMSGESERQGRCDAPIGLGRCSGARNMPGRCAPRIAAKGPARVREVGEAVGARGEGK